MTEEEKNTSQITINLPKEIKEEIEAEAKREHRPIKWHIEHMLSQCVARRKEIKETKYEDELMDAAKRGLEELRGNEPLTENPLI